MQEAGNPAYPAELVGVPARETETDERPSKKITATPQQYNKKSVNFGQGLDFLNFSCAKSRKNLGKSRKIRKNFEISGPKFLIKDFLILLLGCMSFKNRIMGLVRLHSNFTIVFVHGRDCGKRRYCLVFVLFFVVFCMLLRIFICIPYTPLRR